MSLVIVTNKRLERLKKTVFNLLDDILKDTSFDFYNDDYFFIKDSEGYEYVTFDCTGYVGFTYRFHRDFSEFLPSKDTKDLYEIIIEYLCIKLLAHKNNPKVQKFLRNNEQRRIDEQIEKAGVVNFE